MRVKFFGPPSSPPLALISALSLTIVSALDHLTAASARELVTRQVRSGVTLPTHLYQAAGNVVRSYPLDSTGLPKTNIDWELAGGLSFAYTVGFDGAGYLYVADADLNQVRVYAPGASGKAEPVRIITIPPPGNPYLLAVNKAGFVFSQYGDSFHVLVYPPGAGNLGPTPTKPLRTMVFQKLVTGIMFDSVGRLYISSGNQVMIYYDPVNEWQAPNQSVTTTPPETYVYAPIAIDERDSRVYFTTQLTSEPFMWQAADHAGRSLATSDPDLESSTRQCNESGYFGAELSLAVDRNYIMFMCATPWAVLVYHNISGQQSKEVERLPGAYGMLLAP